MPICNSFYFLVFVMVFFPNCLIFREDPFSVYEANCGFYNEQEEDCCKDLNHTDFPVYTPAQKSEVGLHRFDSVCSYVSLQSSAEYVRNYNQNLDYAYLCQSNVFFGY